MLQAKKPNDYVIATGKSRSVREFVEKAFKHVKIKIKWKGKGIKEEGYNSANNQILVKVDPKYFRPTDINELRGDYSKARRELGWKPKTTFDEMVRIMVESDLEKMS